MKVQHPLARAGVIGLALAVSACSVIQEDKIDYKSAQKASTLEVPPDLTQLSKDTAAEAGEKVEAAADAAKEALDNATDAAKEAADAAAKAATEAAK